MDDSIVENVASLSVDVGEVLLDSFLNEGLFKDFPILGSAISIIKLSTNISDLILLRKIKLFINNLNVFKQEDVNNLKEKMNNDKSKKEIAISLLGIIDKINEDVKIEWISKIFLDYLNKKIDRQFFLRIISIINNTFLQDIISIKEIGHKKEILSNNQIIVPYVLHQLFSNGLLDNYGLDGGVFTENGTDGDNGTIYKLNIFGKYIYENILNNEKEII